MKIVEWTIIDRTSELVICQVEGVQVVKICHTILGRNSRIGFSIIEFLACI